MKTICKVEDCGSLVRASGLCNKHYHVKRQEAKRKPCACGCGELTSYTYKHGHHTKLFSSEEQSRRGRMNTGDKQRDKGTGKSYRKVRRRHEHRTVAEAMLGRPLIKGEIVHHKNHNKRDNRPENLEVMNRSQHIKEHLPAMIQARKDKYGY